MSVFLELQQKIKEAITESVVKQGWLVPTFSLEIPKDKSHGDFACNVAMQLVREVKMNPRAIAQIIIDNLDQDKLCMTKAEIAGPGFINLFMDKRVLHPILSQILELKDTYGGGNIGQGQKINVEFVSANPTGSLHLGHARGAAVGDSLCRILDFAGYDVTREYYINDAGNQIHNLALSLQARYLEATGQNSQMPEDGYFGQDIIEFAQELKETHAEKLNALSDKEQLSFFRTFALNQELEKIKQDLLRFGVTFDVWTSEQSLYEQGEVEKILQTLKKKGQIYEHEGATWLKTTMYEDDKDRVLIKNDGTYTYLVPDIAYHENKYQRGFDELINILGADHHGYIPRLKASMQALGYDADRLHVLICQLVSLYQNGEKVKMSKRTGKAVTMEELLDEVGVDAMRYFFTMRGIDTHLDFDLDLAISTSQENPVFYVQYANARICSIFRQIPDFKGVKTFDLSYLTTEQEFDLLSKLGSFPEEVCIAAQARAPHRIVRYVYELATLFHSYYKAERVIIEDENVSAARLALLQGIQIVLKNALHLIGVKAPERM